MKYNAEDDKVYHLSKKHHVSSYPTGIILNKNGYVLNRKYGFPGEDYKSLSKSVFKFTNEAIQLNRKNKIVKGYSNKIDVSKYPKFYIDYVNRDNKKIDDVQFENYLKTKQNTLSEEYFSTLLYFGRKAPNYIAENALKNRQKYLSLYGKLDTDVLFYFLTSSKFNSAIKNKSQIEFDNATFYAKKVLSKKWVNDILPMFKKDFLIGQNKWGEVFNLNKQLRAKGNFSDGAVNHFCWTVYKKCEDPKVIAKCLVWMKELTERKPIYAYLDTYAFLLYKFGDKEKAKKVVKKAIQAGKKEQESTKNLEKLLSKL